MDQVSQSGIKAYWPLIVIIGIALFSSLALHAAGLSFMHGFMGLFFVLFSMVKLFDLPGFAKGFSSYDLIAKRWRGYAYVYPVMELGLGLAYLSGIHPILTNLLTILLMAVSAAGVLNTIRSGMKLNCACLGSLLNVPLSTVSVVENLGMGLMAAAMLLQL